MFDDVVSFGVISEIKTMEKIVKYVLYLKGRNGVQA